MISIIELEPTEQVFQDTCEKFKFAHDIELIAGAQIITHDLTKKRLLAQSQSVFPSNVVAALTKVVEDADSNAEAAQKTFCVRPIGNFTSEHASSLTSCYEKFKTKISENGRAFMRALKAVRI